MWRRVFVRTGFCAARVHTRRRRSGGGCRARPPAPMARDRGAIRLPCPALRPAAGGSGVGSSPSSEEAARGCARRAGPVARDLRVGPSGRHARRRDADGRVCVGRRRRSEAAGLRIEQLRRRAVGRDFWGLWDRIEKKQACGRRLTTRRCALQTTIDPAVRFRPFLLQGGTIDKRPRFAKVAPMELRFVFRGRGHFA